MPELPEVETTRRGIEPWVMGTRITGWRVRNAKLRWPVELPDTLKNQTVRAVLRRGKYILLCTPPGTILIHLGMSGSLRILDPDTPPLKHDHVDLIVSNGRCLRLNDPRRFGSVLFQAGDDPQEHPLLKDLGIEPLGNDFGGDVLFKASRRRKGPVKNFIMDSRIVVGVGNIYAADALSAAGIRPGTAAGRIPAHKYDQLAREIVAVLSRSVREGGTTLRDFVGTDGQPGYFKQRLFVYGRQGKPCRVCTTLLKHQVIGQRSSVYCPKCQTSQKFAQHP